MNEKNRKSCNTGERFVCQDGEGSQKTDALFVGLGYLASHLQTRWTNHCTACCTEGKGLVGLAADVLTSSCLMYTLMPYDCF